MAVDKTTLAVAHAQYGYPWVAEDSVVEASVAAEVVSVVEASAVLAEAVLAEAVPLVVGSCKAVTSWQPNTEQILNFES